MSKAFDKGRGQYRRDRVVYEDTMLVVDKPAPAVESKAYEAAQSKRKDRATVPSLREEPVIDNTPPKSSKAFAKAQTANRERLVEEPEPEAVIILADAEPSRSYRSGRLISKSKIELLRRSVS